MSAKFEKYDKVLIKTGDAFDAVGVVMSVGGLFCLVHHDGGFEDIDVDDLKPAPPPKEYVDLVRAAVFVREYVDLDFINGSEWRKENYNKSDAVIIQAQNNIEEYFAVEGAE